MSEATAAEKEKKPAPTRKICPLRKMKLISDIAALGEVDAPCLQEACAWWDAGAEVCAISYLPQLSIDIERFRETLKEMLLRVK